MQAKEIMYHKANLNRIMSECTGQPIEKVPSSPRPLYMMRCLLGILCTALQTMSVKLTDRQASADIFSAVQIDEDTDRDRYMSPLEAKQYGLIDHVIGGDEAGFKASHPPDP